MATIPPPDSSSDQGEPRAVTSMSCAPTHSHRSSRSREEKKLELVETTRDKRRLEGKANPMKALHEAQPPALALEDSTLQSVRNIQHRDRDGNVIADPDRSNPTRPRMERPLDTIRSFDAAAEGTTSRRSSYQRQPSQHNNFDAQSRRSSHYGNPNAPYSPSSRPHPGRGKSQVGYYNRNHYGVDQNQADAECYQNQGPPHHQRFQSAPMKMETQMHRLQPQVSPLSQHAHQRSYETMNTNISGSGSEEMSKSTNPSSQNSSFDQLHQMTRKPEDFRYPHRMNGGPVRSQHPPSAMTNNMHPQQPMGPRPPQKY